MAATADHQVAADGDVDEPIAFPPITTGKVKRAFGLIEKMTAQHRSEFVAHGEAYRADKRAASTRPANPEEIARLAAGMLDETRTPEEKMAALQGVGLEFSDDPTPQEFLAVAAAHTAPAFLDIAIRLTVLLEMPNDEFEDVSEAGRLEQRLDELVAEADSVGFKDLRVRGAAAFEAFADAAGFEPGKAWARVGRAVWDALVNATQMLTETSESSSLTGFAPPTGESPA